jgi:hypothetical protein
MICATEGGMSAMFLVVTTMKSNGFRPPSVTFGIELRTERTD